MDVMAQAKRPMEDTTHHDVSIKRFKEMARAPKKNRRRRFGFQDFPISRDSGPAVSSKGVKEGVVNT